MTAEPTYDRNAELAVLAACLQSPLARERARQQLVGSDFYQPVHEAVWDAMARLERHKRAVDATTVLTLLQTNVPAARLLPDLVTHPAIPDNITEYAAIVRKWATARKLAGAARAVLSDVGNPGIDHAAYAASAVNRFAAIRDADVSDDSATETLAEVLADPDDEPDWLVPGYLERRDRLMLTGEEGLGKSHLLRQIALCAAAGIDPWGDSGTYPPARVMIWDCENSRRQIKAKARGIAAYANHYGAPGVMDRVFVNSSSRIDLRRDRDLAMLHREVDLWGPDLIVIGPMYRLVSSNVYTDEDAAPVLAALDTLRDRGAALLIEAHAGHSVGKGGVRDLRPRGSSALLGWPEFGYGLRDLGAEQGRYAAFVSWRGDRSERNWPRALRRADDGVRWVPYDGPAEMGGVA